MSRVNNSVTFRGKTIGSVEFLNRIAETLSITIDRHPKGKSRKMERKTIEKIGYVPNFIPYSYSIQKQVII